MYLDELLFVRISNIGGQNVFIPLHATERDVAVTWDIRVNGRRDPKEILRTLIYQKFCDLNLLTSTPDNLVFQSDVSVFYNFLQSISHVCENEVVNNMSLERYKKAIAQMWHLFFTQKGTPKIRGRPRNFDIEIKSAISTFNMTLNVNRNHSIRLIKQKIYERIYVVPCMQHLFRFMNTEVSNIELQDNDILKDYEIDEKSIIWLCVDLAAAAGIVVDLNIDDDSSDISVDTGTHNPRLDETLSCQVYDESYSNRNANVTNNDSDSDDDVEHQGGNYARSNQFIQSEDIDKFMEPLQNEDHGKFNEAYGKSHTDGTIITELSSQYLMGYPETTITNQDIGPGTTIRGDISSTGIASGRLSKANHESNEGYDSDGDDSDGEGTVKSHKEKLCGNILDEQELVPAIIEHYVSDNNNQSCPSRLLEEGMMSLAINSGDLREVEHCLEHYALDHNYFGYLKEAIISGQVELVKYFLARPISCATAQDDEGKTLLHHAVNYGNLEMVQQLTNHSTVDINVKDNVGNTPIHDACTTGRVDIVQLLLERGAQVDPKNGNGHTPLFYACEFGHLRAMKTLVERGADVNVTSNVNTTPLHVSIRHNHFECVRYLLENCNAIIAKNFNGSNGLHIASTNGSVEIAKYLLQSKKFVIDDKNKEGATSLHIASNNGHFELVKMLVHDFGANVKEATKDESTSVHLACSSGRELVCGYLLDIWPESVVQTDSMRRTPLHLASLHGHFPVVQLLLQRKEVNVNAIDKNGCTAVKLAIMKKHHKIVQYLSTCDGIQKEEIVKNLHQDNEHDQNCDDGKTKASSNGTTNTTSLLSSDLESVTTDGTMIVESTITRKRATTSNVKTKNELTKYFGSLGGSSPKTM
jgi:ankyrin repeat protein